MNEWNGPAFEAFTAAKHSSVVSKAPMKWSVPCVAFVGDGSRFQMFVTPGKTSQWVPWYERACVCVRVCVCLKKIYINMCVCVCVYILNDADITVYRH